MSNLLLQVMLLALIPVAATIAGGVIAAYKPPGRKLTSYIQHFAAGVVLAAVAGELLPDIVEAQSTIVVIVGFLLGLALMLCVKLPSGRLGGGGSSGLVITIASTPGRSARTVWHYSAARTAGRAGRRATRLSAKPRNKEHRHWAEDVAAPAAAEQQGSAGNVTGAS